MNANQFGNHEAGNYIVLEYSNGNNTAYILRQVEPISATDSQTDFAIKSQIRSTQDGSFVSSNDALVSSFEDVDASQQTGGSVTIIGSNSQLLSMNTKGGAGNDNITTGAGDDSIEGGLGDDTLNNE